MSARELAGTAVERVLPAWPFALALLGYPLWWVLGLGDSAWILLAGVMLLLLRGTRVQVPRGFGVWLLFLVWMACSALMLDSGGRLIGFAYRYLLYATCTVFFLYLYNARSTLTVQRVLGVLCGFWVVVWVGGYLGLLAPTFELRTPLTWVLPDGLLANELVSEMAVRRLTQYNPDAYNVIDPRPSAPFLYTNGWGNAYSVLLPLVLAYLGTLRRGWWFWTVVVMVPVSLVPAFLSLNRGMFLGLGVALVYVVVRLALRGHWRALVVLVAVALVAGGLLTLLPVTERLSNRLEVSSTTEDRASLYLETLRRTAESPLLGYGAPRPSETAGAPSAGTQGQFWMVLFSHGVVGAVLFVGWLLVLLAKTLRAPGTVGLVCHTVVLVTLVEIFYYGIVASGLMLALVAAALALRHTEAVADVRRPGLLLRG
ncbi:hypothetical protein GC722_04590 [Auraticoccus sp. F435]|uniref:O-antigen ligase-related domain-containing protein n=1 Tax=Auraticoccus cholistanensis TaxID=2656650 RepID=A0A6A9URU7_9ACTN|nr:O-antigen ligase family protein [Auraticoccus cholistanensis]MVA75308.1 hypothetical protein [Auraticoccus cholistanensis]